MSQSVCSVDFLLPADKEMKNNLCRFEFCQKQNHEMGGERERQKHKMGEGGGRERERERESEREREREREREKERGKSYSLHLTSVTGQTSGESSCGILLVVKPANLLPQHGSEGQLSQSDGQSVAGDCKTQHLRREHRQSSVSITTLCHGAGK